MVDAGGMAIFSRHPLEDTVVRVVGGWPQLRATVRVGAVPVRILGVHVVAPVSVATAERQDRQLRLLVTEFGHLRGRRLIVGDFNASQFNDAFDDVERTGVRSVQDLTGQGLAVTWPNGTHWWMPGLQLDHCFVSAAVVPLSVRQGTGVGSDHRPLTLVAAVVQ